MFPQIDSDTFAHSSIVSIVIPSRVEVLGKSCFTFCLELSSISFESNAQLMRIESSVFSPSSLESFEIPHGVEFIHSSAFSDMNTPLILIAAGNEICIIENDILVDFVHHRTVRSFSKLARIEIPANIEVIGSSCFAYSCVYYNSLR
jgi:hypothetical protein